MCLPWTFAWAPAQVLSHAPRGAGTWQGLAVTFLGAKGNRGDPDLTCVSR